MGKGLGMILAGLSGAGNAMANVGRDYQKSADEEAAEARRFDRQLALERLRADMSVEQAARIAENQRVAAEAPAKRFSALLSKYAGEEIPDAPAEVTELSGAGTDTGLPGLHGNPQKWTDLAASMPPGEMRDLLIKQLNQQVDADQYAAAQAAEGMSHKRTSEEATAAALAEARLEDPTAYLAGKALGQDKHMQVGAGGAVIDAATGKIIFQNSTMSDKAELEAKTKLEIAIANNASDEKIAKLRDELRAAGGGNTPAIVSTANWLFDNGIAKTKQEAWLMAKTSAAKADSDNVVKIAGILANQPGYEPQSNTGKGHAADLFADAAKLAEGVAAVDSPSPAPARPAAPGARQVGDIQIIATGPHKGKAAQWDGVGWVLKN